MQLLTILLLCVVPNGTLVMSNKPNTLVGNIAKRITNGAKYTHIGIVFDGYVYESDYPRSQRVPIHLYGKPKTVNDYYYPVKEFPNIQAMKQVAIAELNKPYRLRNYFRPRSKPTYGTWCSPYVAKIFDDSGIPIPKEVGHEPQRLLNYLRNHYYFHHQVKR